MDDFTVYRVVVNHEERYSIWPAEREPPLGWRDVGKTGSKEECLEIVRGTGMNGPLWALRAEGF